jgi:predicted porin
MKKTLIALAAVAATGAAFAQSSVTLYGVADVSIAKADGQSTKLASSSGLNNGTSRWGVRGSEDLGGGMKAGFTFEQGISLENGNISKSGTGEFGRAAWMNLSGGFGDLRLGRSLNPAFYAAATWELTGTANYSVATKQWGGALNGFRSNGLIYTTPSMGGFKVMLGHQLKANDPGEADVSRTDLTGIYANGPMAFSVNYNKPSGGEKSFHIGGRYTMGMFTLAGAIVDPAGDGKGFNLGAGVKAGPVNLVFDIARDTFYKDTDFLLEAKYPMSKRTTAYFAFQRDGKGKTAENANNVGLGVRHNF